MPTLYEGLGTEELLDNIDLVLRRELNTAIDYQQVSWDQHDQERATEIGKPYTQLVLEKVDPVNFHVGSIPSFVQQEDRLTYYPMVATAPGNTVPDAEDAIADQYSIFQNAVEIHAFTRANPIEGATIAWRRAERMSEAIHQVISTDVNLRRVVAGISGPLFVRRTEPWAYPVEDGHGEDWWFYGIGRTYQIKNYSIAPAEVF